MEQDLVFSLFIMPLSSILPTRTKRVLLGFTPPLGIREAL
jgi:hypothetical protein